MRVPAPSFSVQVDVTNPGEFFACCGLLELAHRLWPRAEGWFSSHDARFHVSATAKTPATLGCLVTKLMEAGISGELSEQDRAALESLESKKRALRKEGNGLHESEEEHRVALGKRQREGAITLPEPFGLRVQWWQEDGDDIPKTFAGRQEVLRIATAMLAKLPESVEADRPLPYRCRLEAVGDDSEERTSRRDHRSHGRSSKVEPFYFDACRFANALDTGFSLDVQEQTIRATAAPLTEFLALIGLQRFRPAATTDRWTYEYWTWALPLPPVTATGIVCGAVTCSGGMGYRFQLRFRDAQRRYKAFGFATPIGGNP